MIAKHVPLRANLGSSFARLAAYIAGSQGKQERIGDITVTNCQLQDLSGAVLEIRAIQEQNKRASEKTYHLLISFPTGEAPGAAQLAKIEDRLCGALGYGNHQRISAVHRDTDNLHVHVAINKVHPHRLTCTTPFNDHKIIAETCAQLERELGLKATNHAARRTVGAGKAADMENAAGHQSLIGWIRRECAAELATAQSWAGLHAVARQHGLDVRERGNGLVFMDGNGVFVKASSVAREFSKASLEKSLGPFAPAAPASGPNTAPRKSYANQPMPSRAASAELYQRYQEERQSLQASNAQRSKEIRARRLEAVAQVKEEARAKRALIKLLPKSRTGKRLLYAAVADSLRKRLEEIALGSRKERSDYYSAHRKQSWHDWLQEKARQGDREALAALRARAGRMPAHRGHVGTAPQPNMPALVDGVTKQGTVIYAAPGVAVRDEGYTLKVSDHASQEGLQKALQIAVQKFGTNLKVHGDSEFQRQVVRAAAAARMDIVFDDPALEIERRKLSALHLKDPGNERHRRDYPHVLNDRTVVRRGDATSRANSARPGRGFNQSRGTGTYGRQRAAASGNHPGILAARATAEATHSVSAVPQLGLVQHRDRAEMLLPRDVRHNVEQQRPAATHGLRRNADRPRGVTGGATVDKTPLPSVGTAPPPKTSYTARQIGGLPKLPQETANFKPLQAPTFIRKPRITPGEAAAATYIEEREAKRASGIVDIPKHTRYNPDKFPTDTTSYVGTRKVDGHFLALVERNSEVTVIPVDEATARRLQRLKKGAQIQVTKQGIRKAKGRSR